MAYMPSKSAMFSASDGNRQIGVTGKFANIGPREALALGRAVLGYAVSAKLLVTP
jgi:hypothetical protein